ncbi:fibronectin type III domain-containing protein [Actinoplanes sp. NPDC026670]|uniref:RCC1 domain-containing protein n=1 Tax=Actinoplanes sp. NPDC026670 TaxID=3154700 RepID=UPI0033C9B7E0
MIGAATMSAAMTAGSAAAQPQVTPAVPVVQVTAGQAHTCGLGGNGRAYCWGSGYYGQLGNGGTTDRLTPVMVSAPAAGVTFTQLIAGTDHTCGLGSDSKTYCWGSGGSGQLGDGSTSSRSTPVAVSAPAAGVTFTQLAAGYGHTCGLGSDSKAYCWGRGGAGQLGDGGATNRLTPVAVNAPAAGVTFTQLTARSDQTCGLGSDNKAYCWGSGGSGQLGDGNTIDRSSPVAVDTPAAGVTFTQLTGGRFHTCGLGSDSRAYCWGSAGGADGPSPVAVNAPAAGVTFTRLTAGDLHTCGLGSDSKAYCWGSGGSGQLGDGNTIDRSSPVAVDAPAAGVTFIQLTAGTDHTCGVGSDNKAYCWGLLNTGQLGTGGSTDRSSPVAVSAPAAGVTFTQLTAGRFFTCGLGSNGKAYCWGRGGGVNGSTPVVVDAPTPGVTYTRLAAGGYHVCGLGSDSKAYCWGGGNHGQLGDGGTAGWSDPVAVDAPAAGVTFTQLTAGEEHSCGLGSDSKAYCWGSGGSGQLGDGGTTDRSSPVAVDAPAAGVTFTQLAAAGERHTCGLGSDGKAYCWGSGRYGQLGDGSVTDRLSPVAVNAPATGVTFTELAAAGYHHTCGQGSDGKAYCWGSASSGRLGDGGTTDRLSPVAVNAPATGVTFTEVIAGSDHTCGLGSDTVAYCWGKGASGQLGDGVDLYLPAPVAVSPFPSMPAGPQPPTGVTAAAGDQQVVVSWTAPANLGDGTLTGFTAAASPGGQTCTGIATTCTITGLANGTAYTVTVTTGTTAGTSAASDPSAPVTPQGVPQPPTGVPAAPGERLITVIWTPPLQIDESLVR